MGLNLFFIKMDIHVFLFFLIKKGDLQHSKSKKNVRPTANLKIKKNKKKDHLFALFSLN
jgi:hypothetical protein